MSRRLLHAATVFAALLLLAGCGEVLDTDYGQQTAGSVDGASVLLARLEARARLRRAELLTPRLQQDAELIVHLAEDTGLPDQAACDWLSAWLHDQDGRQAVIILRGASPAPLLCRRWAEESRVEAARLGGTAGDALLLLSERFERAAQAAEKVPPAARAECPLFALEPGRVFAPRAVVQADGRELAVPQTMRCGPRVVAADAAPLLAGRDGSGDEAAWAVEIPVGGSRLVVAVNASPILDGALPDPAARTLFAAWLDALFAWHGDGARPAAAWVGSLRVRDGEPEPANPLALVFTRWPVALAAWHLVALVLLWLAMRAWWLGRRDTRRLGSHASFAAHVEALAGRLAAERHHNAAARAIARAAGLPAPPILRDAEHARAWLCEQARRTEEPR